jgi:hypothetical protein
MSEAMRFKIENGRLAFALVDTAAAGYADSWQAPAGKTVDTVTLADYEASSSYWSCQVTEATIDASPNANDETVDATWCEPSKVIPNPGETSFAINGNYLSDSHFKDGLFAFLYAHDTKEAYFLMGLNGDESPPRAIGRVRLVASSFGGPGRTSLTAALNALPLSRRYDAWVGSDPADAVIIPGYPPTPATGATAGTPGTWTPAGSTPPATVAALIAGTPNVVVASPATAWTVGQYVQTQAVGAPGQAHWSGSAWVSGPAT